MVTRAVEISDSTGELAGKIEREPNSATLRFQYGMVLHDQHQYSAAANEFQSAVAVRPTWDEAQNWLIRTQTMVALKARERELRIAREVACSGLGGIPPESPDCTASSGNDECEVLVEAYFNHRIADGTAFVGKDTEPIRTLAWSLVQTLDPDNIAVSCAVARYAYQSESCCPDDLVVYALVLEAAGRTAEAKLACEQSLMLLRNWEMQRNDVGESVSTTRYEDLIQLILDRLAELP